MLEANYSVLVLSRNATPALSPHANLKVAQTDYDVPSLVSILKAHSVDTVVCALSSTPTTALIQTALIEATLEAGVSRYVPTYWGSDVSYPPSESLARPLRSRRSRLAMPKQPRFLSSPPRSPLGNNCDRSRSRAGSATSASLAVLSSTGASKPTSACRRRRRR